MPEPYLDVFRDLWHYQEFRVLYHTLRLSFLAIAACLIVVALLHMIYVLGYNSPLYRRKSPKPGWTQRLFLSVGVLFIVLLALYWWGGYMIAQVGQL